MLESAITPLPDLLSPEHLADPYPDYERLRRDHPVQEIAPGGIFAVSRHDDVELVLTTPDVFSSAGLAFSLNPSWLSYTSPLGVSLITKDGAAHTRLRTMVNRAFAPRRVAGYEPRVRAIAAQLADRILADPHVDFVEAFSSRMPLRVIAEVVGFDPAKEEDIRRWMPLFDSISPFPPGDEVAAAVNAMLEEVDTDMRELIARRRTDPKDDLLSDLVRTEPEGTPLTDEELVSFLCTLLVAGIDTTKCLLGNMLLALTSTPGEWERLRHSPSEIPAFVDRILRSDSPVSGSFRVVTTDTEIGGTSLPAGSLVFALISSANHDTPRHGAPTDAGTALAFGHGIHYCFGAPLARMEAQVAMEELLARFAGVERTAEELEWIPNLIIRGVRSLPLSFRTE